MLLQKLILSIASAKGTSNTSDDLPDVDDKVLDLIDKALQDLFSGKPVNMTRLESLAGGTRNDYITEPEKPKVSKETVISG
jgi:hypothetical protein